MGDRWNGLDEAVEEAWRTFRVAVGDRLSALAEGEAWVVDLVVAEPDEILGAVPFVEVRRTGPEALRAETAGNECLDPDHVVDAGQEAQLVALGWVAPSEEHPRVDFSAGFWLDVGLREADRLAALTVRTLREVHGCLHPAFLSGHDLSGWAPAVEPAPPVGDGEPLVLFPGHRDDLVAALDAAVGEIVGHPPVKDDDGDIAMGDGPSVVFLRVLADRPVIELFSEVVREVADLPAMAREIELLNRRPGPARFHSRGTTVVMRQELLAWPFTRSQLGVVLGDMLETVGTVASELVERIGGHAFDEVEPDPLADPLADLLPEHLPLRMLLEMLHAGPVPVRCAAEVFDRDRVAIIATIVAVREGLHALDGHDEETVLDMLRLALRLVVDGRAEIAATPRPGRRLCEQPSLIDDAALGEDPLDLDWSA